ncbi:hypothetical protein FOY51_14885 [Antrihabitans cavernicola]|uniref:Secreted protein n=1 Tax=Antrihabitans cavernicola TaxID=2495913 RepID=A0A5A7S9V6_9NOCA|nr:hypothetical protein FOY51_14885 [Spelaeibacter cavernicola]
MTQTKSAVYLLLMPIFASFSTRLAKVANSQIAAATRNARWPRRLRRQNRTRVLLDFAPPTEPPKTFVTAITIGAAFPVREVGCSGTEVRARFRVSCLAVVGHGVSLPVTGTPTAPTRPRRTDEASQDEYGPSRRSCRRCSGRRNRHAVDCIGCPGRVQCFRQPATHRRLHRVAYRRERPKGR